MFLQTLNVIPTLLIPPFLASVSILFPQFCSFLALQVAIYLLPGDFNLRHFQFVGGELNWLTL